MFILGVAVGAAIMFIATCIIMDKVDKERK